MSELTTTPLDGRAPANCVCYGPDGPICVCPPGERRLRHIRSAADAPAFSDVERHWCLAEIGRVEGYDRKDYEGVEDGALAQGVLWAWTDYCRDKGLL